MAKTQTPISIVVACGPTACGKTALATALARKIGNAEIVSADSRQVYRGLDIGSGKDLNEYGVGSSAVPYHMIDIADPSDIYTLYNYQHDVVRVLLKLHSRGVLPVMVGGSGLYIEAVLRGYRIPNVPEDPEFREKMMTRELEALVSALQRCDPEPAARTDLKSKKRVVRALEIARYAEKHDVSWGIPDYPPLNACVLKVHLEREEVRRRIDRRLDERLEQGLVEEVRGLMNQGVTRDRLAMLGLEYKHVPTYLSGEADYATMKERLRIGIHQFAKRQATYFRGMERRGTVMHRLDGPNLDQALSLVEGFLSGAQKDSCRE